MNHGKCINCFWHKWGHCFIQNCDTQDNSYCPDYYNRKREKESLNDIINEWLAKGIMSASHINRIKQKYIEGEK